MIEIMLVAVGLVAGIAAGYFYGVARERSAPKESLESHPLVIQLRQQASRAEQILTEVRVEKENKIAELATMTQLHQSLQEKLANQMAEVEKLRLDFSKEFENLANRIFEEKTEKFTRQNKDQLDGLLLPFKEKLKDFEDKVEKAYGEENRERIHLRAELKTLADLNKQLSSEANNLSTALKGSNKVQGNWGELVLEKILERSGLQPDVEYKTQHTSVNQDGERIRPDIIVMLPDEKHIVIDSKVSLIAYNSFIAAENEEDRKRSLSAHVESVRQHVKGLGEKNYQTARDLNSPDFVLLFMPLEAAFAVAMQADNDLFGYAWDRKIVIVSPTTLLATLRTVASIWKQERQTRHTLQIAEEGGKLYDKFVMFTEDLLAIGRKMDDAKKNYEDAMNKLALGNGNLVKRSEKMRELGARATKRVNSALVQRANATDSSADNDNELSGNL